MGARAPGSILDHCFLDKLPGLIILSRVLSFVLNPQYVLESLKVLFFWETPALAATCTGRSRMPPKSILIISYWSSSWRFCLIHQLCSEHINKSFQQSSENQDPCEQQDKRSLCELQVSTHIISCHHPQAPPTATSDNTTCLYWGFRRHHTNHTIQQTSAHCMHRERPETQTWWLKPSGGLLC